MLIATQDFCTALPSEGSNDERTEEEILSAIDEIERAGKPQTWGAWASEPTEASPPAKSTLPESYWRNLDEQRGPDTRSSRAERPAPTF